MIHRDHARTMIKACCKILCTDDALVVSRSSVQVTWNDIVIVLLHLMAEGPLYEYLGILCTYARRSEVISRVLVSSAGPWRHRSGRYELWERQASSEQSVLPMNSVFSLGSRLAAAPFPDGWRRANVK